MDYFFQSRVLGGEEGEGVKHFDLTKHQANNTFKVMEWRANNLKILFLKLIEIDT